jgi:anti-sigma factor RsiW
MLGTTLLVARASEDFAIAAVTTHVRATLDDRLIAVASSDRHTVKPWLSARLDYSPPVQDLADDGFPLVGGRLEQLDGRAVATLVYRYRRHSIDVFVRPHAAQAPTSNPRSVRGFNVARARGATMDWLAVSDAEPEALLALVTRLAREDVAQ